MAAICNFWVLKLRIPALFKILLTRTGTGGGKRLTYIETGKTAHILLKLLTKLKLCRFPVHRVPARDAVAGPELNLAWVRDDTGRVITLDVYRHILDIRREITGLLMERYRHLPFFRHRKPANTVHACLSLKVAQQVNPAVYLAHFGRWKYHQEDSRSGRKIVNTLVIPRRWWNDVLVRQLDPLTDRVWVQRCPGGFFRLLWTVTKSRLESRLSLAFSRKNSETGTETETAGMPLAGTRMMVYYAMGVKKGERNDIGFMHDAGIDPSRLLMYMKYKPLFPSPAEMEWLEKHDVPCFASPGLQNPESSVPDWEYSPQFKSHLHRFYRLYLKTVARAAKKTASQTLWLLAELWDLGKAETYWRDFFMANKVGILVNSIPTVDSFIPNMALSQLGGTVLNIERSILFDYCTYIHNPSSHVNLLSGPYSLGQIPEPSFSLHTLQVGALNKENSEKLEEIRLLKEKTKLVIAVFDETANDVFFGDSIGQLYRALVELVTGSENGLFSLLIKTKKPQVLEKMPHIKKEIGKLVQKGNCIMADWRITVPTAAAQADLVVCVPSTAAFESVLTGTPTIVFNPMRSGSRLFYTADGLNRRVFEEGRVMTDAIKRFAHGSAPGIGDCRDLAALIDPFGDGSGSLRVGNFIKQCLHGYDSGIDREQLLETCFAEYTGKWGQDKLSSENAYEYEVEE